MNSRYQDIFDLAREAISYADIKISEIAPRNSNIQEMIVGAMLPRLFSSFQACIILGERGLSAETLLLARKVLEATFRIVAISKNAEVAELYAASDEAIRCQILKKLSNLQTVERSDHEQSEIEELKEEVQKNVRDRSIQDISTKRYAEYAGMADDYNTAYAFFSQSAHLNPRDIEELIEINDAGEAKSIKYGPSEENIPEALSTAVLHLVNSLSSALELFNVRERSGIKVLERKILRLPYWNRIK